MVHRWRGAPCRCESDGGNGYRRAADLAEHWFSRTEEPGVGGDADNRLGFRVEGEACQRRLLRRKNLPRRTIPLRGDFRIVTVELFGCDSRHGGRHPIAGYLCTIASSASTKMRCWVATKERIRHDNAAGSIS